MSFVGNKQIKGEIKLNDKFDENLKNKIKEKLNELQTKNTLLNEKVKKNFIILSVNKIIKLVLSYSKKKLSYARR